MGYIKEPKGIDFIVQSRNLTKAEELAISEHIKNYKLKNSLSTQKNKSTSKSKKAELVD